MGELPVIVEGNIDDSDEELIARVNTWLIDILGEPGSLTVDRITRVTEEIQGLVGGRGSGFPSLQRREERTPLLSLSSKIRLMIVS